MLRTTWDTSRTIIRNWLSNNLFELAAALSYYTLLSMAPLLLLLTGLAGLAPWRGSGTRYTSARLAQARARPAHAAA